ncbi:unnamed protein product, partial [Brassica rapa subsp. trilocularis]
GCQLNPQYPWCNQTSTASHSQVQDMMARQDLLVQQVRASARWELMKEWLENRVEHWDPKEEYLRHLFLSGGWTSR